jgi:hypothetical protein
MSDLTLKLCPFCKSAPRIADPSCMTLYVQCSFDECPASWAVFHIDKWNSRPVEDALRAELADATARAEAAEDQLPDEVELARRAWQDG